jgi:hypothetical protein
MTFSVGFKLWGKADCDCADERREVERAEGGWGRVGLGGGVGERETWRDSNFF